MSPAGQVCKFQFCFTLGVQNGAFGFDGGNDIGTGRRHRGYGARGHPVSGVGAGAAGVDQVIPAVC